MDKYDRILDAILSISAILQGLGLDEFKKPYVRAGLKAELENLFSPTGGSEVILFGNVRASSSAQGSTYIKATYQLTAAAGCESVVSAEINSN